MTVCPRESRFALSDQLVRVHTSMIVRVMRAAARLGETRMPELIFEGPNQ